MRDAKKANVKAEIPPDAEKQPKTPTAVATLEPVQPKTASALASGATGGYWGCHSIFWG